MKKLTRKPPTNQYRHTVKQAFAAMCRRYNIRNRVVDENDFQRICKGEKIRILSHSTATAVKGFYVRMHGRRGIYLAVQLSADERLWVGFHELGHHFLHGEGRMYKQFFHRITKRYLQLEVEANLFAELALGRKVEVKFNVEK